MRKEAPDFIITGDIHLRDDAPICRTDDYWEAQARKIRFLDRLQKKYKCPVLDAGDMFDRPKPSLYLLQWAVSNLPDGIFTVPGNHDLPGHNQALLVKSGLGVLKAAGAVEIGYAGTPKVFPNQLACVWPFPWGSLPTGEEKPLEGQNTWRQIALMHVMTYTGRKPYPGCVDPGATSLLKTHPQFDLIITGHNHQTFTVEHEGRRLVNVGSLMRSTADQEDKEPQIAFYYGKDNHIEWVPVPISKDCVITREHLDRVQQKEDRITAFVSRLSGDFEIGLSFEKNMEHFFATNRIRKPVQDLVWELIKGE